MIVYLFIDSRNLWEDQSLPKCHQIQVLFTSRGTKDVVSVSQTKDLFKELVLHWLILVRVVARWVLILLLVTYWKYDFSFRLLTLCAQHAEMLTIVVMPARRSSGLVILKFVMQINYKINGLKWKYFMFVSLHAVLFQWWECLGHVWKVIKLLNDTWLLYWENAMHLKLPTWVINCYISAVQKLI